MIDPNEPLTDPLEDFTLKPIVPTPEQQAILSAASDSDKSILISALAGTGKTSTLVMLARQLQQPGLAIAFNTKAADELKERFPQNWSVMTLNALGNLAWKQIIGKYTKPDGRKLGKIVTEVFDRLNHRQIAKTDWQNTCDLVTLAMNAGIVPKSFPTFCPNALMEDTVENWTQLGEDNLDDFSQSHYLIPFAREALTTSVRQGFTGYISFDEQIYLPCMFNGRWPKYNLVLADEVQDFSKLNALMLKKVCTNRLILVGDKNQAIYSWRGADCNSIENLKTLRSEWIELPLSTTFRCPQSVVKRQLGLVPDYKAAESNPKGEVIDFRELASGKWTWDDVDNIKSVYGGNSITVLCRNNAPLLSLAFKLLKLGLGVNMVRRDISKNLTGLAKKLCGSKPRPQWPQAIQSWRASELSLAKANKKLHLCDSITDRADCLLAIIEGKPQLHNFDDLEEAITEMFSLSGTTVTLSTIHSFKGLESDSVLHLDPFRIPSIFVLDKPDLLQQEWNLNYVCETRTKHTLILANLRDFKGV